MDQQPQRSKRSDRSSNRSLNPSSSSSPSSASPSATPIRSNWDPLLSHSSAIGILKPNAVFNVFNQNPPESSSAAAKMASQLPQPRLVRTTHDLETGLSHFASDSLAGQFRPFGPQASGFSLLDVREAVPVRNMDPPPPASAGAALPRCPPAGVVATVTDIPAGGYAVPMHRTLSLDYAVVVAGEIVLTLDSGEERTLRAGDYLVQQGVNHSWANRTNAPCRIFFCMVGAEKLVRNDGTPLEETVFNRP